MAVNLSAAPRALLLLALFAAAILVLGGIIARLGRNAGSALRSVA